MEIEEAKVFLDNLKTCINEHPIVADWLVEIADRKTEQKIECLEWYDKKGNYHRYRKTENCSEIPNNCEDLQDWKDRMWAEAIVTEPTGYNLSPVDKDINVRSKDEPQADGILFKGNLKEGEYKLIKTTNGWVLEGNDIAYCGEPQSGKE